MPRSTTGSRAGPALALLLALGLAQFATNAALASRRVQQAPASRIAIELPDGFEPSVLFSGFTHEGLGVSIVVVEMPEKAYEELEAGMTAEALAAKGILNARRLKLARAEPYLYMQAEQSSAAGDFAKFFVVLRERAVTALITANVQKAALDTGEVRAADIEKMLASARVAETPAPARELFRLGQLGPFKPAGHFLGTARIFTLDGRPIPGERSPGRPTLIVAPSLDRRPVTAPEAYAERLIAGLPGLTDVAIRERRRLTVAGLDSLEMIAAARDGGVDIVVYHVLVLANGGGYFRIVGQAPAGDRERLVPEFRRIAEGFEPLR